MKNAQWKYKAWFFMIAFFIIVTLDWSYIYHLAQEAAIITHWVIVSPIIMTLFFVLSLFTCAGIYLKRTIGFYAAYLIIGLSVYFAILSYQTIETMVILDATPIILILSVNFIFALGLLFLQLNARHHS